MGSSALTLACELTYASAAVCLVLQGSQTVDCAQDCTVDSITLSGNPHYSDVLHDGMAMCAGLVLVRCEAKVSVTAAQLLLCTHCPENVTWLNITQLSMSCYAGECMPQLGAHKVHLDDWRTNAPGWPWMMETSNKISLETPRECSCEQT